MAGGLEGAFRLRVCEVRRVGRDDAVANGSQWGGGERAHHVVDCDRLDEVGVFVFPCSLVGETYCFYNSLEKNIQ